MNQNSNILFSVIIPTYNRAEIIGTAIESVLNQTYPNWELIIIDDGSTDNTRETVKNYSDSRIKYYYKKNEERSKARNYGIDNATGEYISFLDDDDYYLPHFLMEFHKKILKENKPAGLFMCREYTEDENGNKTKNHVPEKLLDNPVRLLWEIQTSIRPFTIHQDILKKKRFKENCPYGEDFHLAIRIALEYPFYYVNKFLSVNVIHNKSGTHIKFIHNYRENAEKSLYCIYDLIENNKAVLYKKIPIANINDLINHRVYGFASAAMKHCDFTFWWKLLKKLDWRGSLGKTCYYFLSLTGRMGFYIIKCLFRNIK